MPILDFDKLTPDNQAVKDLKDLIQLTVFQNEDMERFMTAPDAPLNIKKWLSLPPKRNGKSGIGKFLWKCAIQTWKTPLPSTALKREQI